VSALQSSRPASPVSPVWFTPARASTRARATWAYSCPGRATRARANRASSALRASSAEHLPTPSTSVRHRVHARATRSAPSCSACCGRCPVPPQRRQRRAPTRLRRLLPAPRPHLHGLLPRALLQHQHRLSRALPHFACACSWAEPRPPPARQPRRRAPVSALRPPAARARPAPRAGACCLARPQPPLGPLPLARAACLRRCREPPGARLHSPGPAAPRACAHAPASCSCAPLGPARPPAPASACPSRRLASDSCGPPGSARAPAPPRPRARLVRACAPGCQCSTAAAPRPPPRACRLPDLLPHGEEKRRQEKEMLLPPVEQDKTETPGEKRNRGEG
jgi:hypothetical protein